MADFSLRAVFGLDTTSFRGELASLRQSVTSFASSWVTSFASITGLAVLGREAIQLAEQLEDLSANLGVTTEALQTLDYLAIHGGMNVDQMHQALTRLKLSMEKAAEGTGKESEALQTLGLNSERLLGMPLERKFQSIAMAAAEAHDQNAAFTAVAELFGVRIGPQMIQSLRDLAENGFAATAEAARESGLVMSHETIQALARAGEAIDDFKRQATIGLGEIIVNFRSEEGIAIMGAQFMGMLARFGGGLADAIYQAGAIAGSVLGAVFSWLTDQLRADIFTAIDAVARTINRVLPQNMQINIAGIQELMSAGSSFEHRIASAIGSTEPTAFKNSWGQYWDEVAATLSEDRTQRNADSERNRAEELRAREQRAADARQQESGLQNVFEGAIGGFEDWVEFASRAMKEQADYVGAVIEEEMRAGAERISNAMSGETGGMVLNILSESQLRAASDEVLRGIIARNRGLADPNRTFGVFPAGSAGAFAAGVEQFRLLTEADRAQAELDLRNQLRTAFALGGAEAVFRAFPTRNPIVLDEMLDQFVRNLDQSTRTANTVEDIARGLRVTGVIPRI